MTVRCFQLNAVNQIMTWRIRIVNTPRINLKQTVTTTSDAVQIMFWKTWKSLCRHAWLLCSGLKWCTVMLAHLCQSAEKYFNSTNLAFHQQLSLWETCSNRTPHRSQNHGSGDEGFKSQITLQPDRVWGFITMWLWIAVNSTLWNVMMSLNHCSLSCDMTPTSCGMWIWLFLKQGICYILGVVSGVSRF